MNQSVEHWRQHRSSPLSKALLLIITDGWAWDMHVHVSGYVDQDGVPTPVTVDIIRRKAAVANARNSNIKIKIVIVGAEYLSMEMDVEDKKKDIILVTNCGSLVKDREKVLVKKVCHHDIEHLEDAMQSDLKIKGSAGILFLFSVGCVSLSFSVSLPL